MIKHLTHTQLNKQKWDAAITDSASELVYAYSWYLDVVCPNWEALVLNDYEAVMPLTGRKKFGFNYLYTPFFIQQLGVFSKTEIAEKLVEKFIGAIPTKYKFVEINLNSKNVFEPIKKGLSLNQNFELSLDDTYDNLKKNYSENTKRNLKKAEKSSLKVDTTISAKAVVDLFRTDRGATIKNLNEPQYLLFEKLITKAEKHISVIKLGICDAENSVIAGAILLKTLSKITFLFSGNSEEGKQNAAMFLLIDHIIKQHSTQHLILDFEGSNNVGLAQFYKGFGSSNVPYPSLKINKLPKPFRWLKK